MTPSVDDEKAHETARRGLFLPVSPETQVAIGPHPRLVGMRQPTPKETHLFAALAEAIAVSGKLLRALAACPGAGTRNDRPMGVVVFSTYLSAMHDALADEMGVSVGKRLDLDDLFPVPDDLLLDVDGWKSDSQN